MKKLMGIILFCVLLTMLDSVVSAQSAEIAVSDAQSAAAEQGIDDIILSDDPSDFVLLSDAVPDAILEIRYYSTYNFVGDRIDGYEEPLAFLTKEAAAALKEVSDELVGKGYRLKIYDAYRPQRAVTHFVNWSLDADDVRMKKYFYPELEKDVLFPQGYILAHSGHSRGSTVDLTLFDMALEKEVDMGGTFDYFGELSHPDYTGITEEQYANRMILRDAMLSHGFRPLAEEWWHFTLDDEPFPDTYFTFPVNSDALPYLRTAAGSTDTVKVSFLGPEGTYTEEAAQFWFQDGEQFVPKDTVNDAIEDVLTRNTDFAVIPQENTLGGAVVNYVDALIAADDAFVVGEVVLPISQTLMGVPGAALEDIKTVCSHVQGLRQSSQWCAENLPDAVTQEMPSTAAAAGYVAEQQDRSIAAVAAPGAARLYGLEVLAENIQITDANKTRFYVLSRQKPEDEGQTRAVFVVTCDGNQLGDFLAAAREAGLDLVSLHDRPEGSSLGRYHFVVEVEGETGISDSLVEMLSGMEGVRFAGRFNAVEKGAEEPEITEGDPLLLSEFWTEGSEPAAAINAYLLAVTDESSPDFIPVEDRIAVFDLDGTLMSETYPFCFEYMVFADYALNSGSETITDEVRAVAQEIMDAAGGSKPDGMSTRQAAAGAIAYQGMTMDELAQIVADFKDSEAWGFSGMTRGEAFYKPMVELFEKLQENDFTVYVVTATERNIVREVINGTLDIPPSQVIGTEYGITATGQGDVSDTDYTFSSSDQIVFDGTYYGENAKTSKVDAIVREIGQQPVLAFGNSSGDLAMEIYTISDNPYRSAAFMVMADDEMRDYGDAGSAAGKRETYENLDIGIISMRDDFKTIYGEDVVKTETSR